MNQVFLFLIAIPLGVYLVALLFQTFEMDAPAPTEQAAAHETHVDSELDTPHQPTADVVVAETVVSETQRATSEFRAPAAIETVATIEQEPAPIAENESISETIEPAPVVASAILSETISEQEAAEPISDALPVSESNVPVAATTALATELSTQESVAENAPTATETVSSPTELEIDSNESDEAEPILPEGPLELPEKGSPKFAFDYRGRLWIEKRNKGFFRQLRRPQLPPDEPPDKASRG